MLQSENWLRLKGRLLRKNLQPYDVGGSGDCFFRSVSHQLFGTPDKHLQVRLSGVNNLRDYPHYYIEFNVDSSWLNSELDLQTCSDDDLTEVILDCPWPCIEVKYDNNSKVTELSSFDI